MMPRRMVVALGISLLVGGLTAVVMAQNNFDKVEIKTEKLARDPREARRG